MLNYKSYWNILPVLFFIHAFIFIAMTKLSPVYYIFLLIALVMFFIHSRSVVLSYTQVFVCTIFSALIISEHVKYFLVQPYLVSNKSMLPSIHPGDLILVEKFSMGLISNYYSINNEVHRIPFPWQRKLQSGDVIVFKQPETPDILIKRIEMIENNKYCVYGDNKESSLDSRIFGCISEDRIIGRYIFRIHNG